MIIEQLSSSNQSEFLRRSRKTDTFPCANNTGREAVHAQSVTPVEEKNRERAGRGSANQRVRPLATKDRLQPREEHLGHLTPVNQEDEPEETEELETPGIVETRVLQLLACRSLSFSFILSFATCTPFKHASQPAIYAYVYLCTKQSARTCRARNISRVPIELATLRVLSSRFAFPTNERGSLNK